MNTLQIAKAIVMIVAVSVDAFAASFSYGTDGIKIPLRSKIVIHTVNIALMIISILLGSCLTDRLPINAIKYISCAILAIMGTVKLCDGIIKAHFHTESLLKKDVAFSVLSIKFILSVYANPRTADADKSKLLSPKEAAVLAVSLSADSVPIGISLGLMNFSIITAFLFVLLVNEIAMQLGNFIGKKAHERLIPNLSWTGGAILLLMAVTKIL